MDLFTDLFTTQNLIAFVTLLVLEIVLGIDNVIFIAILSARSRLNNVTSAAS